MPTSSTSLSRRAAPVVITILAMIAAFGVARTASALLVEGSGAASGDAAASAEGDTALQPVADQLQQAYYPGRLDDGQVAYQTDDLWFHGAPTDQATKVLTGDGPTFDRAEPTGSPGTAQTGTPFASPTSAGSPLGIFWSGPFTGTIEGPVVLRWWWSSPNVAASLAPLVNVSVFADPDPNDPANPDKLIGQGQVSLSIGPEPTYSENVLEGVSGTVAETLLIQVSPVYADAGQGWVVHYDSTDHPSGFGIVTATDGSGGGMTPSTTAVYDGEPLSVSAIDVGRHAAEPTVGVLSDGTAFYAAGSFDALPDSSPSNLARTEVLRSSDGGRTWASVQPRIPVGWSDADNDPGNDTEDPGSRYTTLPPTTLDPYVYVDERTDRVFNPELYAGCTFMNYSDDGAQNWSSNPVACGDYVNDHQTIFAGPPPDGVETAGYPNVVYYCFNRVIDANCGRSLDGGDTWTPTATPAFLGFDPEAGGLCGGLHGHIKVDSEGRLFVPKGHCGNPWVGISEDAGDTWQRVQASDLSTGTHTHLAIAVDAADNLYFLYWDADRLPWLQVSTDHGQTWGEPMMIAPPGVREVNFPVIEGGDEGRIAITFPGTTEEGPTRAWNSYVVVSTNALDADPLFVSTTANDPDDPVHRGNCEGRCGGMYDFLDVITAPADGTVWATGTDNCPARCVDESGEPYTSQESGGKPGFVIVQVGGPSMSASTDDGGGGDDCQHPAAGRGKADPKGGPCDREQSGKDRP